MFTVEPFRLVHRVLPDIHFRINRYRLFLFRIDASDGSKGMFRFPNDQG